MPIIRLLSAGAGKRHGRPHCLHSYPLGACLGARVVRNRTLGSGLGCQKLSSHPPGLALPAPSPTRLTFWSSQLSRMFQGDNTDPGDLLEVGPRRGGTNSCLGQRQLPPSQGALQTCAKQGHIIATSGSRGRAVRSRVQRVWLLLTGSFKIGLRMHFSSCSHFSPPDYWVHSSFDA